MSHAVRILRCLFFAAVWWAAAAPGAAQEGSHEVEVQLSLADGKSVFRAGDPIRLVLSFTASAGGYRLDTTTTTPASPIDEILLSPDSGVSRWLDEYSAGNRYRPDYASVLPLSETPTRVELPLNALFRFDRPGRYAVRVKTARVSPPGPDRALTITTNEVIFEVVTMSEEDEGREVRRLSALLEAARDWREEARISEELSFLTGDAATREKLRHFLAPRSRSGNFAQHIYFGLFMARNRGLVVRSLEAALRDPGTAVTHQMLNTLAKLRLLQEGAGSKRAAGAGPVERPEQQRFYDAQQAYVRELAASLPKRAGKSRTTTAMTILMNLPKEQARAAEMLKDVRKVLLSEFDGLHQYDQEYLLRVFWDQLRDPALAPAFERMLTRNRAPQGYLVRATALKRLMELSEERARPFVVAEVRDPASRVDFDVLRALSDPLLPEADDALLERIRELAPLSRHMDSVLLRHQALLAARYATPAVYDGLMEAYETWGAKWPPDARGALLGYFARHNEEDGMLLTERALAELDPGHYLTFLLDLSRAHYSGAVDAVLRKRLEGDEPEAVSAAAYIMSQYGPAVGRQLIEARLHRWVSEWRPRAAELDADDARVVTQRMLQVNLIVALTRAKSWKLSEAQARQLMQGCITQGCRQHFHLQ